MNREKAKEIMPLLQAYTEGKTIQQRIDDEWIDLENPCFDNDVYEYRIKPESKYRPFKTAGECWNEMLKHQPFGWVRDSRDGAYLSISYVEPMANELPLICMVDCSEPIERSTQRMSDVFTFADGTFFGIKEEEE